MPLRTRLTERFGLEHPILSAPMAFVAGGALAAAVSRAGGLGLIGGGYGNGDWLGARFAAAGNQEVGCGFITWSLALQPYLLTRALDRRPRAIMLSFGDPVPFADEVRAAGAALICQVQTLAQARRAIDAGAEVVVAQGAEAGGHGAVRGTTTLVPEVRDLCARAGTDALVLAAGGIADGRGLAAALVLGAAGVNVGTRFLATVEAQVPERYKARIIAAASQDAARVDPAPFPPVGPGGYATAPRMLPTPFTQSGPPVEGADELVAAVRAGRADELVPFAGQTVGLIDSVVTVREVVDEMVSGATDALAAVSAATARG
jgi:nitronate monooxygenase